MPKPKGKRARTTVSVRTKARRAAPAKGAARTSRRKVQVPKPASARKRAVAPKKATRVKAPAKPARPALKPAAPPMAAPAAKAAPAVTKSAKKEATRMATQATCPIHGVPDCFKPALDAYIQQAYDGYCTKIDWPFVRIIPKGWTPGKKLEDLHLLKAKAASPAAATAASAAPAAAAAVVKAAKVEFYYSSKDEPAKNFHCDNKKALDLCGQLKAKGVAVVIQDCASQPVSAAKYNAAVTGPSAAKRAVDRKSVV